MPGSAAHQMFKIGTAKDGTIGGDAGPIASLQSILSNIPREFSSSWRIK
jgi:hypothetical protein